MTPDLHRLKLSDFTDPATMREVSDAFLAVSGWRLDFLDGEAAATAAEAPGMGSPEVAPVVVDDHLLGALRLLPPDDGDGPAAPDERPRRGTKRSAAKLASAAKRAGLDGGQTASLMADLPDLSDRPGRPAAARFLRVLATALERLCGNELQLLQRVAELTALSGVTTMLAETRDLQKVLRRTVEVVATVMEVRASSIRLIDPERDQLVTKAVYNLSDEYLAKGPISLSGSAIDGVALGPQGFEYVRDIGADPRIQYPEQGQREGIVSMLSVGMKYQQRPVGVLRIYTAEQTEFTPLEIDLLKAIASQAAAAIENARLVEESREAEKLERQVHLAADVQQRMLPARPPVIPGLDLAAVYIPAYELGGDLYDFIPLPDENLGIVIADVSGKGVPASLIMASVRAALRAQVDNVYYLYEVVRRVNQMLCRDTKTSEFVTLFYGVIDAKTRRLTYCDAGHPPGLLLRGGEITKLNTDNMILGVLPDGDYVQSVIDLEPDDYLLLYTDGLTDAMNFQDELFGYDRIVDAYRAGAKSSTDANGVAQHILWELRRFVGLANRTDDVTMVVAKVQ